MRSNDDLVRCGKPLKLTGFDLLERYLLMLLVPGTGLDNAYFSRVVGRSV